MSRYVGHRYSGNGYLVLDKFVQKKFLESSRKSKEGAYTIGEFLA